MKAQDHAFLLLLVIPCVVWVYLDQGIWVGDTPTYGWGCIRLFHAIGDGPRAWLDELLSDRNHPPLLYLLGEFFVPLGKLLGSQEVALRLLPPTLLWLCLGLLFDAFQRLFGDRWISAAGCTLVAASPLAIFTATGLWREPLELLSVAWFLNLATRAGQRAPGLVLVELIAASAFALLTKLSLPLFCVVPGAYCLVDVVARRREERFLPSGHPLLIAVAAVLVLLLGFVYTNNLATMFWFAVNGATSAHFGSDEGIWRHLVQWLSAVYWTLLHPWASFVTGGTLLGALLLAGSRTVRPPRLVLIGALLQIALVLVVFAQSPSQFNRYIVPVLPWFALVLVWSLARIRRRPLSVLVLLVLLAQFTLLHGRALGLVAPRSGPYFLFDIEVVDRNPPPVRKILADLEPLLCAAGAGPALLTTKPLFDHLQLQFYERREPGRRCDLQTTENWLSELDDELDLEQMWQAMEAREFGYFVGLEDALYGERRSRLREACRRITARVARDPRYQAVPFPKHPEIRVFWRGEGPPGRYTPED